MRKLTLLFAATLAVYSALLVGVELRRGGRVAREYLDDPPPPLLFHVHTEVSAALLFACALAFAACRRAEGSAGRSNPASARFLESQVVLFVFLAADERFRLLPQELHRIDFPENGAYALLGVVEAALLLGPGRLLRAALPARAAAIAGAALFAVSLLMDGAPPSLPLRACAEDLPKVWGGALFLYFAIWRFETALDALAFPGIAGGAVAWGRGREITSAAEPSVASTAGSAVPQGNGAPARRADAPEPVPKHEASLSSAAPPRKLLSH